MTGERLDSLTGLRWFAALAVFIAHAGFFGPRFQWLGAAGVAFFFCLSGFVLAWAAPAQDSPKRFYRRRFARIYPLHVVTLVAALLLALVGWSRVDVPGPGTVSVVALLLQGWVAATAAVYAVNAVAWTLSHEAFFYAVFPAIGRRRMEASSWLTVAATALLWPFLFAVCLTTANHLVTGGQGFSNPIASDLMSSPLGTVGIFVAGVALARAMMSGWRPTAPRVWIAVALAYLALMPPFIARLPFPRGWHPGLFFTYAVLAPALAVLVVAVASLELSRESSWLGDRRLLALGAWSFAFYLAHWTVLSCLATTMSMDEPPARRWGMGMLALGLSVALAALLHRFVEAPMERRLRGTRAEPIVPEAVTVGAHS